MAGQPKIARKLELHFMGDWGWANLHRMAGWLGSQVMEGAAPGSRYAIWSTPFAASETVTAVAGGEVDLAMSTPAHMVRNALEGRGLFARKPLTNLVSLGTLPQTDSLVLAIDADLGVDSFDDIRKKKPALRISTQPD
ncbi:MAG: TAXI family TRAP transporter solute-binding subunit, partial [Alphaproteobacteria bacterium]